jgi:periplasmic copper chaperone A
MNRRTLISSALVAVLAAMPIPAPAHDDHPPGLHAHDAYVRTMGRPGASGAVFLMLHNNADADDRLVGASSDVADRVELHTHVENDGVMRMVEIEDGIPLPAGHMHALERGGDHVMLLGLTRALAPGDVISLELSFESGATLLIQAPVDNERGEGGMDHTGHGAHGTGHGTHAHGG